MITLQLTKEEAFMLRALLSCAGGSPHHSAREHADTLIDKLGEKGIDYWDMPATKYRNDGSVQFYDYEA